MPSAVQDAQPIPCRLGQQCRPHFGRNPEVQLPDFTAPWRVSEKHNLAASNPRKVAELHALLEQISKDDNTTVVSSRKGKLKE